MVKWGSSFADIQDKATVDALIAERIRSFREVRDMAGPPRPATARDPTLVEERRLALEEERREQLKDIARQRYEDSERARQIREHAATPQVQLLSVAEALVVRLLGSVHVGGQDAAGATAVSGNAYYGSRLRGVILGSSGAS